MRFLLIKTKGKEFCADLRFNSTVDVLFIPIRIALGYTCQRCIQVSALRLVSSSYCKKTAHLGLLLYTVFTSVICIAFNLYSKAFKLLEAPTSSIPNTTYYLSSKTCWSVEVSGFWKAQFIIFLVLANIPLRLPLDIQLLLDSRNRELHLVD